MKNFWENYKDNLQLMVKFSKQYWKALLIMCFAASFTVFLANLILSFIINPKYFFGGDRFLPDWAEVLIMCTLVELMFLKYIKSKKKKSLPE